MKNRVIELWFPFLYYEVTDISWNLHVWRFAFRVEYKLFRFEFEYMRGEL
jgi:hypothetical protein